MHARDHSENSAGRSPAIVDRFEPMVNVAMERPRFSAEPLSDASEEKVNDRFAQRPVR
jgi:hypothetical protein